MMLLSPRFLCLSVSIFLFASSAIAETTESVASQLAADSIWVVMAGALVFFMQAGFALLESGMSRAKNSVNIIMKNYSDLCVGSLAFWAVGYGLMFGGNLSGWFGSSHFAMSDGEPFDFTFLFFQMMFAATAATITSGAMAERTRFAGYLIGAVGICAVIYPIFGSWAWGGRHGGQGWLAAMGFVDFAGSTVVHSIGGWCALAAVLVLGPRLGRFAADGTPRVIPGHNLNYTALGGFILWLGWFGFNAGSTVSADVLVGLIALNTQLAAAAGTSGVICLAWLRRQPVFATHVINGGISGLVAITAGCATMSPGWAIVTGFIGGIVMVKGDDFLKHMQIDDVVGAVSVHGFCGAWGTLAAGMFYAGDLFDPLRVTVQAAGIMAAFLWAFPLSLLMYWLIDRLAGLRASHADERRGLDYTEHQELGYPEFQKITLHANLPELRE